MASNCSINFLPLNCIAKARVGFVASNEISRFIAFCINSCERPEKLLTGVSVYSVSVWVAHGIEEAIPSIVAHVKGEYGPGAGRDCFSA